MSDPHVSRLIRAVQAARRAHDLDEDAYRDLLAAKTGKRSARDCSAAELGLVLDALNGHAAGGRRRAEGDIPAKVRALILSLWNLGAWDDPSEAEIGRFLRRQAEVDDLRFLPADRLSSVVEALRAMCAREGFSVAAGVRTDSAETALARAQLVKLARLAPDRAPAFEARVVAVVAAPAAERKALVRALGIEIRAAVARQGEDGT